ncbi:MAG: glucose-6-phosphate isomerase [Clostridia bacterium]|nr:glucose-6-phosphate isomerase [Clostridia bacterium]
MLNITVRDTCGRVSDEALRNALREAAPLLKRAQAGDDRYADSLGWLNVKKWAGESWLARTEEIAGWVRENCDAFVLIGVGGSNNAARSVIEALADGSGCEIIYAGNTLSPHALNKMLRALEGKDYAVDCIAKNFETLEPGASFRILREAMAKKYSPEEAARRTICTGTYGSPLEDLCRREGYTFVPFPTDVGGRYSVFSCVGLLPMAAAGIDIRALVRGACDMEGLLRSAGTEENPALRYAALRNLYHRRGYALEMLASFEPQLRWFNKWWVQLFAESEGKDGKGIFPVAAEYSEELHAVGQYLQDGAPLMFETFLDIASPTDSLIIHPDGKDDHFEYLDGKDFALINRAAFEATVAAHSQKMPCLILELEALDACRFGQLFYFFQFACMLSGEMMGLNPFDQPGVEAYKGWMFKALGKSKI